MPAALHIHSWFSLLEGTASPEMLVRRAHEAGYTSLALTDTNNLYGVVPFLAEATRVGIRPVVGAHLRHGGHRAVALAADANGYRSLCRLLSAINTTSPPNPLSEAERGSRKSIASAEGRADRTHQAKPNKRGAHLPAGEAMLLRLPLSAQRGSGGVSPPAHSGRGLGGEVATHATGLHILTDDIPLAESLRDAFPGRLWLEVIRPGSRGPEVLAAARRLGLRVVASTAAHMLDEADHPTHRLVTAVRRVTLLDRVTSTPATPRHRLVSAAELRHLFRDMPEAVANGEELASMLRSDVLPTRLVVPEPRTQHRLDLVRYLRALCERGLRERDMGDDLKARARLRRELQIIEANGLPGYFLTVRDIANLARKGGHTMALRGSAGNSLVCYLLGITDVDPLRFGLELERFLHPGRVDLPDIDLDFDWKVRDEIIDKVIRRHGAAHAVRICMQLFFQPRSAFREAGKVHGLSNEQVSEMLTALDERVDSIVIPEPGAPDPPCPRAFPLEPQRWPRMVADARRLLGRPMHPSLHPGGIVITPRPVSDYVPLEWSAKGLLMTQYDKDAIEAIGLVKIDLLGNRALSTVDEAIRHIPSVVPKSVDCHDDPATVDLLRRGDTVGITQLESPAMRHLLIPMRPRGLDDVIQALALLRPGAASIGMKDTFIRRRNGRERTPAAHPLLERVLGETHGLMLYEDDSLRVLQALTGMDAAEADRFRKRIAKHRTPEEAEALRREFLAATSPPPAPLSEAERGEPQEHRLRGREVCASLESLSPTREAHTSPPLKAMLLRSPLSVSERGLGGEVDLAALWEQLAKFNRYSFCKSHAVSYGLIAWRAAWLKAHHPLPFWAAALNNNQGAYPPRVYVEAVKRAGLRVLPPCVNRSDLGFSADGGALRVGLDAVSGVPDAVRHAIVAGRPYAGLSDMRGRVPIGPEALSALVRVGAFDFTGKSRPELFLEAEVGLPHGGELFALDPAAGWVPPDDPPDRRWRDEWRILGFVLGPPLYSLFRPRLPADGPPLIASHELPHHAGRMVRVQGLVATARLTHTEAGRPLQFITLEDEHGLTEVTIFDGTCPPVPYLTMGPYVAAGTVEDRYGALTITARHVERVGG